MWSRSLKVGWWRCDIRLTLICTQSALGKCLFRARGDHRRSTLAQAFMSWVRQASLNTTIQVCLWVLLHFVNVKRHSWHGNQGASNSVEWRGNLQTRFGVFVGSGASGPALASLPTPTSPHQDDFDRPIDLFVVSGKWTFWRTPANHVLGFPIVEIF